MKLTCHPVGNSPIQIVPASLERDWMSETAEQFAYRCLPLNIANAHGWLILNTVSFVAEWTGGAGLDAVRIQPIGEDVGTLLASSHFGHAVLTFHINGLFRTEPGFDLIATGPFNHLKDGIQPLTGVVETDWVPFTFTMNWRFTRKFAPIRFEAGEPFCMIMPYRRGDLEATTPVFAPLDHEVNLAGRFADWSASRSDFNEGLRRADPAAKAVGWQKDYFRGRGPLGQAPESHRTRLRLRPFTHLDAADLQGSSESAQG